MVIAHRTSVHGYGESSSGIADPDGDIRDSRPPIALLLVSILNLPELDSSQCGNRF